jgi:hypothetical protein
MSDASTVKLIQMYMEEATAPMFLSGFFQSPPKNFHTTEEVEFEVVRDDEDVAIVIQDLSVTPRENEATLSTVKRLKPPIYDELGTITAFNLTRRMVGGSPFDDPDYGANAMEQAFGIFRKLERKIRRAIELQASQVLQTGKLTLKNPAGQTLYELDFSPRVAHFPTVGTTWADDGATGDPLADLGSLMEVVRMNGKAEPARAIFGKNALSKLLANKAVRERLDNRAMQALGNFAPQVRGQGATFYGWLWIGQYRVEIWTYGAVYKDPVTNVLTPYVNPDKVIILPENPRLDLTYGAIPYVSTPAQRGQQAALAFLPPRINDSGRGLDLTPNAFFTPDGKHLKVGAGTRPLTIPTAIDQIACLDVTA